MANSETRRLAVSPLARATFLFLAERSIRRTGSRLAAGGLDSLWVFDEDARAPLLCSGRDRAQLRNLRKESRCPGYAVR